MKRIVATLVLTSSTLFVAPTMPGTWIVTGDVQGYPISESCTFAQTDDKIAGACMMEGKKYDTTVLSDGTKFTMVHGGEYEGQALTLTYAGKFNDKGEIAGSIHVEPLGVDGAFAAKKDVKVDAK